MADPLTSGIPSEPPRGLPPVSSDPATSSSSSSPISEAASGPLHSMGSQPSSSGVVTSMPLASGAIPGEVVQRAGLSVPIDRDDLIQRLGAASLWAADQKEVEQRFAEEPRLTFLIRPSSTAADKFTLVCRPGHISDRVTISASVAAHAKCLVVGGDLSKIEQQLQQQPPGSFRLWVNSNGGQPITLVMRTEEGFRSVALRRRELERVGVEGMLVAEQLAYLSDQGRLIAGRDGIAASGLAQEAPLSYRCWVSARDPSQLGVAFVKRDHTERVGGTPDYQVFGIPKDDKILASIANLQRPRAQLKVLLDAGHVVKDDHAAIEALSQAPPLSYCLYVDSRSGWVVFVRRGPDGVQRSTPIDPEEGFWLRLHHLTSFEGAVSERFPGQFFASRIVALNRMASASPGAFCFTRDSLYTGLIVDTDSVDFMKKMPNGEVWMQTFTLQDMRDPDRIDYLVSHASDLDYFRSSERYFESEQEAHRNLRQWNRGDYYIVPGSSGGYELVVKRSRVEDDELDDYVGKADVSQRFVRHAISAEDVRDRGWFQIIRGHMLGSSGG